MIHEINWEPQEQQLICLNAVGLSEPFEKNINLRPSGSSGQLFHPSVADVIGYGGAAGGGKTDTLLAIAIISALKYSRINIVYFRRKFPDLEGVGGAIPRSLELLSGLARYNDQKHRWIFPNGSTFQFCHCQHTKDVYGYQSWQFDILLIDECTEFTVEMVDYLITRNRGTINFPTFKPFTAMGTNPGGIGAKFFKDRFVNLGEREKVYDYTYDTGQTRKHIFIPSRLEDNPILLARDPGYPDRLSTNPTIRRRLREGDWNVISGQYFDMWRYNTYVCRPFNPLHKLPKIGGIDWGREQPFCFLAGALEKVYLRDVKPFYRMWIYHELYGSHKGADDWGRLIRQHVYLAEFEKVLAGVDLFNKKDDDESRSLADDMKDQWGDNDWKLKKANNDRVPGWNILLDWMRLAPDGMPYLRITENCTNLIRTLPEMIHDEHDAEDIDTKLEDHAADALRYLLMGTTWIDARVGIASRKQKETLPRFSPETLDLSQFETAQEPKQHISTRSLTEE